MLRPSRLPPGRRALLPHPLPPTSTTATTPASARHITFAQGHTARPFLMTGTGGGIPRPNPSNSSRFFTRPLSTWSESTIATVAAGAFLGGSWYIWEEGRSYKVGREVDKYEPKVLGSHRREERVNPDYVSYERWVEGHGRKGK